MKTMIIATAALFMAVSTTAFAGDLMPERGRVINLGDVSGAAYYTVEENGLKLVTTLAGGETSAPVRFVSTLTDGQSMTIQVPAVEGGDTKELTFRRVGDRLMVEDDADLRASLSN